MEVEENRAGLPSSECDLNFLTAGEKENLSASTLEKLKSEWNIKVDEISRLQTDIEKTKTDAEQHKFQVEKELVDLRKRLEDEGRAKSDAQNHLESARAKLTTQEEELRKTNEKIDSITLQLQKCQAEQETVSSQCSSLAVSLESKTKLNDVLKEQVSSLEEQLATQHKSKCDALIQAEEASTSQMQMHYKEHRYEQEKTLLNRQVELLQQQLEQRSQEVLTLRKDHSTSMLTMQTDFNHALEEARLLREERESMQKSIEEKSKKIEELLKSLNETRESETHLENSYKKELAAQERLASIYKQSCEDQQKRCEELEEAVAKLKQHLQEASEQFGVLERAKESAEEEAKNSLNQRDILIKDLKDELHKVNELIKTSTRKDDDFLAELSPAASAASQLMRKGLTLSQLYTEYLNTSERLFKSDDENKRLSRYVEQILREIDEKAPLLRKQRDDYERALETINTLHTQMDNSIDELEKQRLEAEEAQRRSNFLGRENDRLSQQVKDLSKQVTVLLTQVEAARTGLPPPPLSVFENVANGTSASDVIGQHLVTFRDVSELQEQNTKLLASLREFTDKLESNEKAVVEAKTQELQDELEVAKKELVELRSGRERMQLMVENITRQRDMYRTLVGQENYKSSTPVKGSQHDSGASAAEVERLKKEVENSQRELEKALKGHEDYRQEKAKNDQMERNEMEKMKTLFDKTRGENIKLLSQAEYNEERFKTLNTNCEAYQRQVNALEEKNSILQGIVGRHEGTIESLREQTLSLTKKLTHLEMMANNLREEKSLFKESEARLMAERDSLHRSQYSQSLLLSNLEAIKNNLEKSDSGLRMRLENQITDLTEQCCRLKAKIESNVDLKEAQAKLSSQGEQLEGCKKEVKRMEEALTNAERQMNTLKGQLQEAQQEKARSTPISSPVLNRGRPMPGGQQQQQSPLNVQRSPSSAAVSNTVRELQVQLTEERARTTSLQASLDRANSNLGATRGLAEQQETQLKESTESNKVAQEEITNLRKSLKEAQTEIKELQEKLQAAAESEKALRETMDGQLMRITEDLEERENELEDAQKKLEDAKKTEEKALSEFKEQSRVAAEMQNKYEKEVILHAADLQALATLKENLSQHTAEIEKITMAKVKAEETLNELKSGFEEREKVMKKTIEELKTREGELDEQNKMLLNQFTELSEKMSAIQTKISAGEEEGNASFTEDEARSSDQLREVIKYLRREREVSTGKVEVAHAEIVRLEAQKKSLDAQVQLLNKYLVEEREKNQSNLESVSKYSEMMRKVHTMDALADSNRLLREEKTQLKNSLEEAKAKVSSLSSQIDPMQERLKETTMKLDSITVEKKSVDDEKELYKKRTQELVEKLNKARPEDMIKLQQDHNNLQKTNQSKEAEINRLKNMLSHVQKNHQAAVANKNQLQKHLQNSRDEARKLSDDIKKITKEKIALQHQMVVNVNKIQSLEAAAHQTQTSQQQEQVKMREQRNQFVQQIVEIRQKEETTRKELEALKKELEAKEAARKEIEENIIKLQRQNSQLRKIANKYKYKNKQEAIPESSEGVNQAAAEEEAEEKKALHATPSEMEKMNEEMAKLKEEIQKKDEELNKLKALDGGKMAKLQADLQKATSGYEKNISDLTEMQSKLEQSHTKKSLLEKRILQLEKEKEQLTQQIETLNKKLSMQQKLLENLQKQTSSGQKVSPSVTIMEKPSSEPPPTANIKPMAAPIPTPAVSSPRSQGASQGGGSRSIPTASIRPMAPTAAAAGQTSVVVVPPMEAHSGGDGAVSSTVTLPQATVTPTPVAPPTLTATVSPTPVSQSSVASTAPLSSHGHGGAPSSALSACLEEAMEAALAPMPAPAPAPTPSSSSADALISQAIALVVPHVEDRGPGGARGKRKLEAIHAEEEEGEDSKRSRLQEAEAEQEEREEEEEEERMEEGGHPGEEEEQEEDTGEPSSSSGAHPPATGGRKRSSEEILILSSDEEGEAPPLQEPPETGREAEAERSEEGEAAPASLQPPPRPLHEPPSSSRQSLQPFHALSHYEEGVDDRIVPSTPTLFAPRAGEGAPGDGVSSPQVPSRGFEFGSSSGEGGGGEVAAPSNDGLSQISEGGIIEVTRMDLAQLDEGGNRSVPTTPMRRSPAVEGHSAEGNISSSGGDSEGQGRSSSPSAPSSECPSSHSAEADSGVHPTTHHQQEEGSQVEEREAEEDGGGAVVVSSQLEGGEMEREEQAPDEDTPEEEEEVVEEEEPEEIEEDEEEEEEEEDKEEEVSFVQEAAPTPRATRSSASIGPGYHTRVTPPAPHLQQQRPPHFASPMPGPRGAAPTHRGSQRARRTRPGGYGRRGGFS